MLRDHGYRTSALHSVPIYAPAFAGTYCAYTNALSALTQWLGGRKDIQPVEKLSGEVLVWLSVWSEVQMI